MNDICGEQHPDNPEITCDKDVHPYGDHMHRETLTVWAGLALPERKRRGGARVVEVIRAMDEYGSGVRTGPPQVGRESQVVGAAARRWQDTQEAWLRDAKSALRSVCESQATFTNEAVWALVDNIREKRAMVLVIKHGIREGWMHEDSAMRVHGTWKTRDGVEFPLNKLVPIYRSDLFRQGEL